MKPVRQQALPFAGLRADREEPAEEAAVQLALRGARAPSFVPLTGFSSDSNTDIGFMARLLTLCSLLRTNPGNRMQYKRQNGPFKLIMIAGGDNKLPFGNLPRLLLAWVCTEVVRTQKRDPVLGKSLAVFMRELGIMMTSPG